MNRLIKFRMWHPKTKEMMPVETMDWDETQFLTEVSAGYTWGEKFDIEAFHETVLMQNTGLFDIRGKEIYEGDILSRGDEYGPWQVVWSASGAAFTTPAGAYLAAIVDRQEIIGNVWENPELL